VAHHNEAALFPPSTLSHVSGMGLGVHPGVWTPCVDANLSERSLWARDILPDDPTADLYRVDLSVRVELALEIEGLAAPLVDILPIHEKN
jgi:hypothetical protein